MDFNNDILTSEELMLQFDMEYKVADTGLPKNVIFDSTGFIGPHTTFSAGTRIVSIDRGNNSATMQTESDVTAATISDTHMDGYFTCSVSIPNTLRPGYECSITYQLLEFKPSQITTIRGNILLVNFLLKVWRPKVINRIIPIDYSSDINEGFLITNATSSIQTYIKVEGYR